MADLKYSRRGAATATANLEIQGLREAVALLKTFDKQMNIAARDASQEIADRESVRIRAAAAVSSAQSRLIAPSIRSRRDRFPAVQAGGGKKVNVSGKRRRRPSAGDIFFGAEFGGGARATTQQFRPHRGTRGYFFWPTMRQDEDWMYQEWLAALDGIAEAWAN
ncbi:hypothetical protein [uncultured Aeromicrobium sp.]|uniref:hypothetical protein n=1 Tax=uncultured Aeromicrobium sp. TaxID=337820 RepID=UPI0025D77DC6|nr:hypothetical protein [uncultured Aeromicrobium sp.]